LASAGLDIEEAKFELDALSKNLEAQGLPREVINQELALQYSDFLRREGVQENRINQLLAAVGLKAQENVVTNQAGQIGLLTAFLGGKFGLG
ncbi:MAG: hypothetical protein MI923_09555, partial [Phycisphaerales bacterium]|nr:hypothetical protein [Phycisphaerales bacterium]